jgi:hypothetical protein
MEKLSPRGRAAMEVVLRELGAKSPWCSTPRGFPAIGGRVFAHYGDDRASFQDSRVAGLFGSADFWHTTHPAHRATCMRGGRREAERERTQTRDRGG